MFTRYHLMPAFLRAILLLLADAVHVPYRVHIGRCACSLLIITLSCILCMICTVHNNLTNEQQINAAAAASTSPARKRARPPAADQDAEMQVEDAAAAAPATGYQRPKRSAEAAEARRERNRKHAKVSRDKKKERMAQLEQQVELLKQSGGEQANAILQASAEAAAITAPAASVVTKREPAQAELAARYATLKAFLDYRGTGESRLDLWEKLLEPEFELRLPHEPYCSTPHRHPDVVDVMGVRIVHGARAVLADASSVRVMLRCLGEGTQRWANAEAAGNIIITYLCIHLLLVLRSSCTTYLKQSVYCHQEH
jgi:Basic region leucine zipper